MFSSLNSLLGSTQWNLWVAFGNYSLINGMVGLLSYCPQSLCYYFLLSDVFILLCSKLFYNATLFLFRSDGEKEVTNKISTKIGRKYEEKECIIFVFVYWESSLCWFFFFFLGNQAREKNIKYKTKISYLFFIYLEQLGKRERGRGEERERRREGVHIHTQRHVNIKYAEMQKINLSYILWSIL